MKNPVTTLKQSVHKNPKPYLIASATAGVVVGVVLTRKFIPAVKIDPNDIVQEWINHMDLLGRNVYVLPKEFHEQAMNIVDQINK